MAQAYVEFQIKLGFRKVVVPTRFIDQMLSDYADRQLQFTVEAFMEAASGEALLNPHGGRRERRYWVESCPRSRVADRPQPLLSCL